MKTIDTILTAIGALGAKVDGINKRLDRMNGTISDHQKRINTNETKIDIATGKATAIGAIFGFIGAVVIACISLFKN